MRFLGAFLGCKHERPSVPARRVLPLSLQVLLWPWARLLLDMLTLGVREPRCAGCAAISFCHVVSVPEIVLAYLFLKTEFFLIQELVSSQSP